MQILQILQGAPCMPLSAIRQGLRRLLLVAHAQRQNGRYLFLDAASFLHLTHDARGY